MECLTSVASTPPLRSRLLKRQPIAEVMTDDFAPFSLPVLRSPTSALEEQPRQSLEHDFPVGYQAEHA
jgi:hypothetical protein